MGEETSLSTRGELENTEDSGNASATRQASITNQQPTTTIAKEASHKPAVTTTSIPSINKSTKFYRMELVLQRIYKRLSSFDP